MHLHKIHQVNQVSRKEVLCRICKALWLLNNLKVIQWTSWEAWTAVQISSILTHLAVVWEVWTNSSNSLWCSRWWWVRCSSRTDSSKISLVALEWTMVSVEIKWWGCPWVASNFRLTYRQIKELTYLISLVATKVEALREVNNHQSNRINSSITLLLILRLRTSTGTSISSSNLFNSNLQKNQIPDYSLTWHLTRRTWVTSKSSRLPLLIRATMHGKLKLLQLTMLASKILTFLALVTLKMLAAILMRKTKTSSHKTITEEEQEPTKLLTPHNLQAILAKHHKSPHPSISSTEWKLIERLIDRHYC